MNSWLEALSSGRVRPKVIAYLASHTEPISTRKLATAIGEDSGNVGILIKELVNRGFISKVGTDYALKATEIRDALNILSEVRNVKHDG